MPHRRSRSRLEWARPTSCRRTPPRCSPRERWSVSWGAGSRLVTRYRLEREGYIRFLLGSTSIADLLRRRRLFNVLLRSDLEAIALLRTQADATKAARDELLAAHVEQDQSVNAEAERRASLQEKIDQQRTLLASIQRERAVHEEAARELEDAEKQLSRKLAEIRSSQPALRAAEVL